jgi:hypothetical protein
MRHRSSHELFNYWNDRRGARPAPDRGEIDPVAIRGVLADTFLLSHQPGEGHPVRIAGTRVCALFGRELRHRAFLDLWCAESRAQVADLIAVVVEEALGVVACATAARSEDRLQLELLLLPLAVGGRSARLIGTLAATPPCWLGTPALAGLWLGPHRYLSITPAPSLPADEGLAGCVRHGLVVYDGGRS